MPTGKANSPGRWPSHKVTAFGFFPKRKIERVVFLILTGELSGIGEHFVYVAATQFTILMVFVVFSNIEIDRTIFENDAQPDLPARSLSTH